MSEEEVQSRCLEIFGESSFTANDVKRLTIEGKSVYQIKLRVLPFLEGMLYLVPDETIRACQRVQKQKNEAAVTKVPDKKMRKRRLGLLSTPEAEIQFQMPILKKESRSYAQSMTPPLDWIKLLAYS